MNDDRDLFEKFLDFLSKLFTFIKTPFGFYLTLIILIILFPPMDYYNSGGYFIGFGGWNLIFEIEGYTKINIIYFLGEIGIVTLVYFIYLQSKKK
jgi:hypothetical protein